MQALATAVAWLSKERRRSRTTPSIFIFSATGRSTPAMDTEDRFDVATCSWMDVPMTRTSDFSGLSCRPFCRYHSLTSAVQAARRARLAPNNCYIITGHKLSNTRLRMFFIALDSTGQLGAVYDVPKRYSCLGQVRSQSPLTASLGLLLEDVSHSIA